MSQEADGKPTEEAGAPEHGTAEARRPIAVYAIGALATAIGIGVLVVFLSGRADPSALIVLGPVLALCGIGIIRRWNPARRIFSAVSYAFIAVTVFAYTQGFRDGAGLALLVGVAFAGMATYLEMADAAKRHFVRRNK